MDTSYNFLLDLALILLSTKVLGLITRKVHMPQVVGALLAGISSGAGVLKYFKGNRIYPGYSGDRCGCADVLRRYGNRY